jgi:probable addiction module antidote protein
LQVHGCYELFENSVVDKKKRAAIKAKTAAKTRIKTKTMLWDSAQLLQTKEDVADYLEAVLEDGDPALLTHALGVIARAKGMAQIGRTTGLGRESLYKALSAESNPEFATVLKVIHVLASTSRWRGRERKPCQTFTL